MGPGISGVMSTGESKWTNSLPRAKPVSGRVVFLIDESDAALRVHRGRNEIEGREHRHGAELAA